MLRSQRQRDLTGRARVRKLIAFFSSLAILKAGTFQGSVQNVQSIFSSWQWEWWPQTIFHCICTNDWSTGWGISDLNIWVYSSWRSYAKILRKGLTSRREVSILSKKARLLWPLGSKRPLFSSWKEAWLHLVVSAFRVGEEDKGTVWSFVSPFRSCFCLLLRDNIIWEVGNLHLEPQFQWGVQENCTILWEEERSCTRLDKISFSWCKRLQLCRLWTANLCGMCNTNM